MTWRPGRKGWTGGDEERPVRFQTIIRAVLEVVPGGVLRAGKTAYADDSHVGFWIGVDADGLAKINIGGPDAYLKWTGAALQVAGTITAGAITGTVQVAGGELQWAGGQGHATDEGLFHHVNPSTYFMAQYLPLSGFLRVVAQNSEPATFAVIEGRATTGVGVKGAAIAGNAVYARATSGIALRGKSDAGGKSLVLEGGPADCGGVVLANVGAAGAGGDALNRDAGDARYLQGAAGWSGTFATGDGRTVTVVNGQVTGCS